MANRHNANRRRTYGRREHELRERALDSRRPARGELPYPARDAVEATGFDRAGGEG